MARRCSKTEEWVKRWGFRLIQSSSRGAAGLGNPSTSQHVNKVLPGEREVAHCSETVVSNHGVCDGLQVTPSLLASV